MKSEFSRNFFGSSFGSLFSRFFVVSVLMTLAFSHMSAGAASDNFASPPAVDTGFPVSTILYTALAVVLVCIVAFKKSGRTHLD